VILRGWRWGLAEAVREHCLWPREPEVTTGFIAARKAHLEVLKAAFDAGYAERAASGPLTVERHPPRVVVPGNPQDVTLGQPCGLPPSDRPP
jgi:hypothetical protein